MLLSGAPTEGPNPRDKRVGLAAAPGLKLRIKAWVTTSQIMLNVVSFS